MNLSIIIPAYNSGQFIEKNIETLLNNFSGSEIIIVNDGSTDDTLNKISNYQEKIVIINHSKNYGKGKALRSGFKIASKDIIIFTDADLPYGIENIKIMYDMLARNEGDVIIGYRTDFKENFWRHATHWGINIIIQTLFWWSIFDTQCGIKGFKKSFIDKIESKLIIDNFTIDIELLYMAKIHKQKILKILVEMKKDTHASTIKIKDIIIMCFDILKIRFNKNYFKNKND